MELHAVRRRETAGRTRIGGYRPLRLRFPPPESRRIYGHDMNTQISPIKARLLWAISTPRRADGARASGSPSAESLFAYHLAGVSRTRIGLLPKERASVCEGAETSTKAAR